MLSDTATQRWNIEYIAFYHTWNVYLFFLNIYIIKDPHCIRKKHFDTTLYSCTAVYINLNFSVHIGFVNLHQVWDFSFDLTFINKINPIWVGFLESDIGLG